MSPLVQKSRCPYRMISTAIKRLDLSTMAKDGHLKPQIQTLKPSQLLTEHHLHMSVHCGAGFRSNIAGHLHL